MPAIFTESTFEQAIIELFENMGYTHVYAPDLNRTDYTARCWTSTCGTALCGSTGGCRGRPSTRRWAS